MKKILILPSFILLFLSCSIEANYNMKSEMNDLHPIEIIYFDSNSQKELGEFPINRKYYGDLILEIEKDEPAYIILKFFFDTEKNEDILLSDTINQYDNILSQATTVLTPLTDTSEVVLQSLALDNMEIDIRNNEQIVLPNPTLLNSFSGIGLVDFITDGSKYLDFPIVSKINGQFLPSLALTVGMNVTQSKPSIRNDVLTMGEKEIPLTDGLFKIDLSEPNQLYTTYSLIDVLNRKIGEMDFNNKIVIVFIDNESVRKIKSSYDDFHNSAEIVADSINSLLKKL